MARIADIVFDAKHPASVARFWAAVLDGYEVAPYDADELARLHALGIAGPEDDPTVLVERPGHLPRLWFQRVAEPKQVKNRVHLDLQADDPEVEVERVVGLGGTVAAVQENEQVVVLADPEGNEFCVIRSA